MPDFADLEKIRELSKAIEDKHTIIKLLDKLLGVRWRSRPDRLGERQDELKKLSLVVSPCKEGDRPIGVVGIIGTYTDELCKGNVYC